VSCFLLSRFTFPLGFPLHVCIPSPLVFATET
jgi:hypothetical protein